MENFTPLSATAGGALIGISVTLLLLFNGRIGGISGIMNGAFFAQKSDRIWRLIFLAGLVLGAFIFQLLSPDFNVPRQNYPLLLLGLVLLCQMSHLRCYVALDSPSLQSPLKIVYPKFSR